MITFLLIWYASGWAAVACWALQFHAVRLSQVLALLMGGPIGLIAGLLGLIERLDLPNPVLWRKK